MCPVISGLVRSVAFSVAFGVVACGRSKVGQGPDTGIDQVSAFDAGSYDTADAHQGNRESGPDVIIDVGDSFSDAADTSTAVMDAAPEMRPDGPTDALYPVCQMSFPIGQPGCALFADLRPMTVSVNARVTVVSVLEMPSDGCAGLDSPSAAPGSSSGAGPATQIVLSTDTQQQWMVYVRIPGLPTDLVNAGDQLDLAVVVSPSFLLGIQGAVSQTVVLSRNGQLVLFSSSQTRPVFSGPGLVPLLDTYGIVVKDDGLICETPGSLVIPCILRGHQALVTRGSQSAIIVPGQTAQIGTLSFSVLSFLELRDTGNCDAVGSTQMVGFATGP